MNKHELVKTILKNIQDIYTISGKFENPDELHQIDIDLALSKVRNLYDLLLNINTKTSYSTQDQAKELLTKPEQSKYDNEKKATEIIIKPEIAEPEAEENTVPEPELVIEKPSGDIPVEEEAKDESVEIVGNGNNAEIIADKFHSRKFVHDNISRKNIKKDVSAKMQSKPIKDINSAIGINDKFIFIKELFENDKEHYHETIQVLNNFDTFENALEFLGENFDWDPEDSNFERLKELVKRKYS